MEERKDGNVSKGNVHDIKKSYKMRKGEKEKKRRENRPWPISKQSRSEQPFFLCPPFPYQRTV